MKYVALALVMLAAGLAITRLADPEPQSFLPIVRLRTTGGLFVTFVQRTAVKHADCARTVDVFSETLSRSCATCVIESSDCSTHLQGIEGALVRNEPLPIYTVDADRIRMALVGPVQAVKDECTAIAAHLYRQGIKAASCKAPEQGVQRKL